jgi:hypothetical protein
VSSFPSSEADVSDLPEQAGVRVASTTVADTADAIEELLDDLGARDAALTLVFYATSHDDQVIARALDKAAGARAVAGTTAGELSCEGFSKDAMTGISFHGEGVRASVEIIPQLDQLSLVPIVHLPDKLARGIGRSRDQLDASRHLWLFLVDGLSGKEGLLTPFFMQAAPRVGLVGASLGDSEEFRAVRLIHHGRVYRDAAATMLLEYDGPFTTFEQNHMVLTDRRLEVTKVGGSGRVLEELDGKVAQVAYAEALGIDPSQVTTSVTAAHPFGYRFRGRPFPVSILQARPDGTFRLGGAIQHGEELCILEPSNLVESTRCGLSEVISGLDGGGEAKALLLFHCLARFLEAADSDELDQLTEALCQAPVCGLNTYGEQYQTLHMNHSLTGVVFG